MMSYILVLNNMTFFFDGGDCCLNQSESDYCFKGLEFCVKSEIGDSICQDYNRGRYLSPDDNIL